MKTQRIQAAFARRREADHNRIEKTAAVNRYFDHWGKVTSRFETWTDADYYQHAEDTLRKEREKKFKDKQLQERREKLKKLIDQENVKYEEELRLLNKPRAKKVPTNLLEKIDNDLKDAAEERRRLDLESKLYCKWRHGTTDENVLFESKTTNHTMAKLNWLDKQIEDRMMREEEAKKTEERRLKLMEETRKREENLKEQQKIREIEIKELRTLQENHLHELKSRESQCDNLRNQEAKYHQDLEKIAIELANLSARKNDSNVNNATVMPHNIKRIKMFIRQRSEKVRDDLDNDILLLTRLASNHSVSDQLNNLQKQFQSLYDSELKKQSTIEAMYESEAKHNLMKWESVWQQQSKDREMQIFNILEKIKADTEHKLSENLHQQKCLVQVRQTHLSAIENSNEKLKTIVKEQDNFTNMIGDLKDPIDKYALDVGVLENISNCSIGEKSTLQPRFGRKKVAWT